MSNSPGASADLRPSRKSRISKCLCIAIAAVILIASLLLILGLTVFKPENPDITVNGISVADLDFSIDAARLRASLNISIDTDVTVRNPNLVGFEYSDGDAYLRYRGNDVGQARIPAGEIGARDARNLHVAIAFMADRLLPDSDFYYDVRSDALFFQTFIRVPGKVRFLIEFGVVSEANCDLEIRLSTRTVLYQRCYYETKLPTNGPEITFP